MALKRKDLLFKIRAGQASNSGGAGTGWAKHSKNCGFVGICLYKHHQVNSLQDFFQLDFLSPLFGSNICICFELRPSYTCRTGRWPTDRSDSGCSGLLGSFPRAGPFVGTHHVHPRGADVLTVFTGTGWSSRPVFQFFDQSLFLLKMGFEHGIYHILFKA